MCETILSNVNQLMALRNTILTHISPCKSVLYGVSVHHTLVDFRQDWKSQKIILVTWEEFTKNELFFNMFHIRCSSLSVLVVRVL